MTFPPFGAARSPLALSVQSPDLFDLDFRLCEVDPDAGTLTTPSGHVGTWTRGATLANVEDVNGTTYTALDGQMAWEQRDWNADGVRESLCLRMGTSDRLAYPANVRVMAMHGLVEFVELGALGTAGATLIALSNDAATGARLWIDSSGAAWQFNYNDGSTTRTAVLSAAPTTGDKVELIWELTDDGRIALYQSINGAAQTVASDSALALPSAWGGGSSFAWRVNARGTGGAAHAASGSYRRVRVRAGVLEFNRLIERR